MTTEEMKLVYSRRPAVGVLGYLHAPSLWTVGVGMTIMIVTAMTGGLGLTAATLWLSAPAIVVGLIEVRGTPLIVVLWRRAAFLWRRTRGETTYTARPEARELVKLARAGRLTLPGRMRNVRMLDVDAGVGVAHDTAGQTATIVATVAAGAFLGASITTQDAAVNDLVRVLRGWTQRQGIKRVCQVARSGMGSMAAAETWAAVNVSAEAAARAPGLWESYQAALQLAGRVVRSHTTEIAITLDLKVLATGVKQSGGGDAGLASVLKLEADTTRHALRQAGFQVTWLSAAQIRGMARQVLDPAATSELQTRAAESARRRAAVERGDELASPFAEVEAGGEAVMWLDEHARHVETDSGCHRTFWVGQWPAYEVRPGVLEAVIFGDLPEGGPIRHVVNVVSRPVPIGEAMKRIRDSKKSWTASERMRQKRGEIASEADKHEWEELIQSERDLIAGSGQFDVSAFVTISADDLEGLERADAAMRVQAANAGLELHVLVGQQAEALLATAVPIGEGMK